MTTNHRSVVNQLYHQIPIASEELFAYPLEFQELLAYYPGDNQDEELIQQVFSTSDNGQSLPQVTHFSIFHLPEKKTKFHLG